MNSKEIAKEAIRIGKEYLSNRVEEEIKDYAKFFTRPEIIQPVHTPTVEDLLRICQLLVDLQVVRERCVLLYLDIKKASSRLKRLEKELLSISDVRKYYNKEKNKEGREILLYSKCKALAVVRGKASYLDKQCEIVISLLDSHVWTLKSNNRVLSSVPHET